MLWSEGAELLALRDCIGAAPEMEQCHGDSADLDDVIAALNPLGYYYMVSITGIMTGQLYRCVCNTKAISVSHVLVMMPKCYGTIHVVVLNNPIAQHPCNPARLNPNRSL